MPPSSTAKDRTPVVPASMDMTTATVVDVTGRGEAADTVAERENHCRWSR